MVAHQKHPLEVVQCAGIPRRVPLCEASDGGTQGLRTKYWISDTDLMFASIILPMRDNIRYSKDIYAHIHQHIEI